MYRKWKAGSTTKERFLEARKEMKQMQLRKQQKKRKEEGVNLRRGSQPEKNKERSGSMGHHKQKN